MSGTGSGNGGAGCAKAVPADRSVALLAPVASLQARRFGMQVGECLLNGTHFFTLLSVLPCRSFAMAAHLLPCTLWACVELWVGRCL